MKIQRSLSYEDSTDNRTDDDDDKYAKDNHSRTTRTRKKVKKRRKPSHPFCCNQVVCVHNNKYPDPPGTTTMELGVILAILVLIIYGYGTYVSYGNLPTPPIQLRAADATHLLPSVSSPVSRGLRSNSGAASDTTTGGNPQQQQQADPPPAGKGTIDTVERTIVIPQHKWPVSLRDEMDMDEIIHPGDQKTKLRVPKFWSPPIHNGKLMTRSTALQMGSCTQPINGKHNIGTRCDLSQRTIYVGIASYRDFQCRQTVTSIFSRAQYPERVRVGVVDQIVDGQDPLCNEPFQPCSEEPEQALCKYASQIDVYEVKAELSIGPVFARHIGYRLYRGEYYATQSDAHVSYTQNWDSDIITQMEETHNEMAVLTTYLTDVQGSISPDGHSLRKTRPIMCNTVYEGGPQGMHLRHASQPEAMPAIMNSPQLSPWWAAGYSFSRGHFVVNVPYDWLQPMIFQGEEMSIGIRGFTVGYDYYAPERSVCFHHYAVGNNARVRNKVHHFWENDNKYAGTGKKAMARLLGIVHMNPEIPKTEWIHTEEDTYGLGGVRTPEKFYETFGIDVVGKTIQRHLCSFVNDQGRMHKQFTPMLRKDGMGIDYNKINYRFADPRPNAPN